MAGNDLPLVAGIELGGTKAIALVARGREIIAQSRIATTDPLGTLGNLADQLDTWSAAHGPFASLGIASFGPVGLDRSAADYGHITSTPKTGWSNIDVVGAFAARFDVPIAFDTDVAGAALAEYRWGAAQGRDVVVYLTIGTGIGAGILVRGQPVHGLIHPEFGHIRVRRVAGDTFAGACPFHGDCLEGLASGPAIAARAGSPGDTLADDHPVFDHVIAELAEAMAQLLLILSPQRILIGGGVLQHRQGLFTELRRRTAVLLGGYLASIDAKRLDDITGPPALGDLAGPLGAAALAATAGYSEPASK